ncbi:MAG TPA: ATP-binding protein [Pyrinomonadaceae bacterium]|nr:ATP-binding protein [Pyrinomonadaceae bacterium]
MPKATTQQTSSKYDKLRFEVAPFIVEDLGLNLYTNLPRVLVEFVANAYDADSPSVSINLDLAAIEKARKVLRREWDLEEETRSVKSSNQSIIEKDERQIIPLEKRTLPPEISIVITDHGCGMSRDELQEKFLVAGRRRRDEEGTTRSKRGRVLMGRKGLGKLAGFGVAHNIVVISHKEGEQEATRITLDYDRLIEKRRTHEVIVDDEILSNGGGIQPHGTKVILSRLVYGSLKSGERSIANAVGDHFSYLHPDDFVMNLNGSKIKPTPRRFEYAYPAPELSHGKLVEHTYKPEDGKPVTFSYRIRFTSPGKHLTAAERGVRIYAHKRLAAVPDLLDMKTGVHGFHNTHYMDGIVQADFIDDNGAVDYIATDRHSLRWESELLAPMRAFLTQEMTDACRNYQSVREKADKARVRNDKFTRDLIENSKLPKHRKRIAYQVASVLCSASESGLKSKQYKSQLPILVDGFSQGDILGSLAELAKKDRPDLHRLVAQVTELTARELGDFMRFIQGRLDGIEALRKLYRDVDFREGKNEKKLHELFKNAAWLINPMFKQFLTSDDPENVLNHRLAKHLKIGKYAPRGYNPSSSMETEKFGENKRPDLVFLLSSKSLHRIVIVELKAPNTPLHIGHLQQLKDYLMRAEEWIRDTAPKEKRDFKIEGHLIGSKAPPNTKSDKVRALKYEIEKSEDKSNWTVADVGDILDQTEDTHRELLQIYEEAIRAADSEAQLGDAA